MSRRDYSQTFTTLSSKKGKVETVMLKKGYPIETISKLTKLSLEEIEVLRKDFLKTKLLNQGLNNLQGVGITV